ncbi:MAG TPA: hypothetical protein VHE35_30795 [Kofleriaceae bacterium]|nr:hypothetical protein [Kofleriaceae bacterium]
MVRPRRLAIALVAAGALAACGGDDDLPSVDCTAPVPAFGEVHAFSLVCVNCHSTTVSGVQRFGAPPGVNFDDYASAMTHAEEAARRVFSGDMPRAGTVAESDKQVLYRWALCGTPP